MVDHCDRKRCQRSHCLDGSRQSGSTASAMLAVARERHAPPSLEYSDKEVCSEHPVRKAILASVVGQGLEAHPKPGVTLIYLARRETPVCDPGSQFRHGQSGLQTFDPQEIPQETAKFILRWLKRQEASQVFDPRSR